LVVREAVVKVRHAVGAKANMMARLMVDSTEAAMVVDLVAVSAAMRVFLEAVRRAAAWAFLLADRKGVELVAALADYLVVALAVERVVE
jgi:hypothetical protein